MTTPDRHGSSSNPSVVKRTPEPVIIARARRFGWVALVLSVMLGAAWRLAGAPGWVAGLAVAAGLSGLLAVVNVALVRSLYRQLDDLREPSGPPDAAG